MSDIQMQMPAAQPLLNERHNNGRSLIIVLTIMAFLAALAVLFSLSAQRLKQDWQGELGRTATVQLMLEGPEARQTKIDAALDVLKAQLPSAAISEVSAAKSQELLKPWLGNVALPDDLPLPALISIEIEDGELDSQALEARLSDEGLIAEIDDHSRWSDQVGRTGRGLQSTAMALLMLIFAVCIAVSAFATQAALSAQHNIIRVMVQVGATDNFIARLFIRQAGIRGLKGGIIGVILGGLIAIVLTLRRRTETALLPDLGLHWTDGFWMVILALGFAGLCALAAGLTAMRLLKRERRYA